MKDFLKQFFAFYRNLAQSIVDHFAERAARIEGRRAVEHARKVELAKAYEPLLSTAIMGFVSVLSKVAEIEAAKRTKFPPGGIATPGFGPTQEEREWLHKAATARTEEEQEAFKKWRDERAAAILKSHGVFPANDDREWFVPKEKTWTPEDWQRAERMAALLKFEEPTPAQTEAIQRQNAENIRKSAEMWRKFKDPKKPNLYPAEE